MIPPTGTYRSSICRQSPTNYAAQWLRLPMWTQNGGCSRSSSCSPKQGFRSDEMAMCLLTEIERAFSNPALSSYRRRRPVGASRATDDFHLCRAIGRPNDLDDTADIESSQCSVPQSPAGKECVSLTGSKRSREIRDGGLCGCWRCRRRATWTRTAQQAYAQENDSDESRGHNRHALTGRGQLGDSHVEKRLRHA